jgi:hypothetical protein
MRRYASFFEWFDQGRKELGVVEELVESLNRSGAGLSSPRLHRPDPPDCVCLDGAGRAIALEVTEVVCETAARLTAQGHDVMRAWRPGELAEHIAARLTDKDSKRYNGGPFAETLICLFTDEPMLTPSQVQAELRSSTFGPFTQVTGAYLVMSYDPHTKTYPVVPLKVAA